MKTVIIVTFVLFISSLAKTSHGYMCFECNSLNDTNCFDLSPQSNVYIGVSCESSERVQKTCFSAHLSEHKKRRMVRGCKPVGICDEFKKIDQSSIYFDVIGCGECDEHFCNKSPHRSNTPSILILLLSLVNFLHFTYRYKV